MSDKVLLAHGSGGKLSHDLVQQCFVRLVTNPALERLDDSAILECPGRLAFTTDSYVINPIFFPGGNIGKLAVCGTVNDLSRVGATPLYISLGMIIEEGLLIEELQTIAASIQTMAEEAGVQVVTGDTKVVNRGSADRLFITTAGIGRIPESVDISGSNARPGDAVILSGSIGDHGIAVLGQREGLSFSTTLVSDCAPLNGLVAEMLQASTQIRSLRDPTRGGLATTLNELGEQSNVGIRIDEIAIPVKEPVRAACEMLGFDPLYVANEGKLIAIVAPEDADKVLGAMKGHKYGAEAAVIGQVVAEHKGRVVMKTRLGTSRIVDMLTGDLLPRIC